MRRPRFHDVAEQLLDAGISPGRVRRMVAELADHFDDLLAELEAQGWSRPEAESEAFSRLDAPAMVESVLSKPELRSWVRRWPWAAFTILPLAIYVSLFVLSVLTLIGSVELMKRGFAADFASSAAPRIFGQAFVASIMWILPTIAGTVCCAIALSRRAPAAWAVVSIVLISALGALTNTQIEFAPTIPHATVGAGIGFSTEAFGLPLTRAACTLTILLAVYFWLRRTQKQAYVSM